MAIVNARPGASDPAALSGHPYPPPAVIDAERYWWHLARLRESKTRHEAASHAWNLVNAADRISVVLAGDDTGEGARDTWADPWAWVSLAGYLACLASALDGSPTGTGWKELGAARNREEFTAAWLPASQDIALRLRGFAAAQVTQAAKAATEAPW